MAGSGLIVDVVLSSWWSEEQKGKTVAQQYRAFNDRSVASRSRTVILYCKQVVFLTEKGGAGRKLLNTSLR